MVEAIHDAYLIRDRRGVRLGVALVIGISEKDVGRAGGGAIHPRTVDAPAMRARRAVNIKRRGSVL
jgi:hypothetical protein